MKPRPKFPRKRRSLPKFQIPEDQPVDYKNVNLLKKFLNDRGKLVSRRISGISAKEQRLLTRAVKQARFLALLTTGGVKAR